jgi:hypothetical protein
VTGDAFVRALTELGVPCALDVEERLAVLRPIAPHAWVSDAETRARVVALALTHGFTHVALDLAELHMGGERAGAPVSGD